MKRQSKFFGEFKKFILRGNVMVLITAFVIFIMLKVINRITEKLSTLAGMEEEKPEPATKKCPFCYSEIDIRATRCPHCTSVLDEQE